MAPETNHRWLWLGVAAVGGVFYITNIVIYRIFFHPLARYPGPLIAKVTDGYQLYHAWKGDRHLDFNKLHGQYGFRFNVRKAEFYDAFAHPAANMYTHATRSCTPASAASSPTPSPTAL
ncbi:hypothetical protein EsH8_XII_000094 [Colletotrichum jinshuiense]